MGQVLALLIQVYIIVIIARIMASWAVSFGSVDPYHPAVQFLHQATEPVLKPVRDLLPPVSGFDFSPIVVLIVLQFLSNVLINS